MKKVEKTILGVIAGLAGFAFFFLGDSEDITLLQFAGLKAVSGLLFIITAAPLGAFRKDERRA